MTENYQGFFCHGITRTQNCVTRNGKVLFLGEIVPKTMTENGKVFLSGEVIPNIL
jgi:hypothetical protein